MVAWEKQKFCYSKSGLVIEHHKNKKERMIDAYEAYKNDVRDQVQDGLIEAYAGCFEPMVEIMVHEVTPGYSYSLIQFILSHGTAEKYAKQVTACTSVLAKQCHNTLTRLSPSTICTAAMRQR